MATYAEKLASVESAIATIEAGGQDVSYEGKRVTYGDLRTLYAERSRLEMATASDTRGRGIRTRFGTPA